MTLIVRPATPWRRLAAAIYDSLLLLGIWMGTTLVYVPLRDALASQTSNGLLPACLFLTGLAFFGWSWTHGGQTPGMLAWHLQVRRGDGSTLRWPVAATRYALMLFTWGLAAIPTVLLLPEKLLAQTHHAPQVAAAGLTLTLANLVFAMRDGRLRLACDRLTNTEVVQLPRSTAS